MTNLLKMLLSKMLLGVSVFAVLTTLAEAGPRDALSVTNSQIQALEANQAQLSPAEKKFSSDLLDRLRGQAGETVNGLPQLKLPVKRAEKPVQVTVSGTITPELKNAIGQLGGAVDAKGEKYGRIGVVIPLNSLRALAERPEVNFVAGARMHLNSIRSGTNAAALRSVRSFHGKADPEGDIAHDGENARSGFQADGTGIKVCVISDSVRYLDDAKRAGSLGDVTVLENEDGMQWPALGKGTGEGTAMLEIIHRIAPGASLMFATGNGYNSDHMAENIGDLVNAGCKIIADDVTWSDESPFHEDAPIARAVQAASDQGVLVFSAAGNGGNLKYNTSGTWEGDFKKGRELVVATSTGPKKGYFHEFAPNQFQDQVLSPGTGEIDLFWNDPLGVATNEYDLFLADKKGNIVYKANSVIDGRQDPHQQLVVPQGQSIEGYYVMIFQRPDAADRHLFIDAHKSRLEIATHGATHGHNASGAPNAFSVAATSAKGATGPFKGGETVRVERFSSDGPRKTYYAADGTAYTPNDFTASGGRDVQKPDLTAADDITTDVIGLAPFKGTSAAAPHAAAIAALILSYRPTLTPAEVRRILTATALNLEGPSWNELGGGGIAMPGLALESIRRAVVAARIGKSW
jgi:subtilisin family serine protease